MGAVTFLSTGATGEVYGELEHAYRYFNEQLFDGELPDCVFTLHSHRPRSFGHFARKRYGNLVGDQRDEIMMNPTYFATFPLTETMQTLVHEMCHQWQFHFGTPGKGAFHNTEWSEKMISIGLMPSDTGQPGGKKVGLVMADYPIEGGPFLDACAQLLTQEFRLSWYDRFPSPEQVMQGEGKPVPAELAGIGGGRLVDNPAVAQNLTVVGTRPEPAPENAGHGGAPSSMVKFSVSPAPLGRSNRCKFRCSCGQQCWAKPSFQGFCALCREPMVVVDEMKAPGPRGRPHVTPRAGASARTSMSGRHVTPATPEVHRDARR